VANAVLYTTVANVAAIPGSPANNAAVEVTNSTGIESFTPLSGLPAGFIGSSGLSVRIIYQTSGATWTWIQYFPNDPETRYLKLAGGTLTGAIENLTVNTGDASIYGVRVGRGLGAISTNTALGNNALNTNTTGSNNTGVGQSALYSNTTGYSNTAVGVSALYANTTGYSNVAYGVNALSVNTIGVQNTANGYASLYLNISGNNNTAHGFQALYSNTTGGTNTCYGYNAGNALTTGSNNTIIGSIAGTAGLSNTVIIGAGATERLRINSSGQIEVNSLGTAAAPVFTFAGDTNTGIYSPGADQIAITTGATGRLFVDASGNVALGSATFSKPFTIINQNAAISLRANSSGTYSDQGIFFAVDGTNYAQIYNDGPGTIIFRNGAGLSERLRISSAGNVGIGTSSPTEALTVNGRVQSQWNAFVNGGSTSYSGDATSLVTGSTAGMWAARSDSALLFAIGSSEKARLDSSGRLGIGTTSPSKQLSVRSSSADVGITLGAGANAYNQDIDFLNSVDSVSGRLRYYPDSGAMSFWTSATERARIDSSGRLLVGTSSASGSAILQVAGDLAFNSGYGSVAVAYGCRAWVNFNGTGTVAIRASGNVSSITDNGVGDYTVNFSTALSDANFAATITAATPYQAAPHVVTYTSSTLRFYNNYVVDNSGNTLYDSAIFNVAIFR
jgi:hypothetical protein